MDEVLVAVPSVGERGSAEILSFAPKVLIRAFDQALKARQSENRDFKLKSPIFIALDEVVRGDDLQANRELKVNVAVEQLSTADRGISPSRFRERVGERIFRSGSTRVRGAPRF